MKNHEQSPKTSKIPKALAVGAIVLGAMLPSLEAGASAITGFNIKAELAADNLGNKQINEAIAKQMVSISEKIGQKEPVNFLNTIAYYHGAGKLDFYIENPLTATVEIGKDHKKVHLIGYIADKGSGAGPQVVMFEDSPNIVKMSHDPADPKSFKTVNPVIFPDKTGAAYNLGNPINPNTSTIYADLAHNPSNIGMFYTAKK